MAPVDCDDGHQLIGYAFTSAEDTLSEAHNWHGAHIFWLLGVWVLFQAAVAFPAGRLRESGKLSAPRRTRPFANRLLHTKRCMLVAAR